MSEKEAITKLQSEISDLKAVQASLKLDVMHTSSRNLAYEELLTRILCDLLTLCPTPETKLQGWTVRTDAQDRALTFGGCPPHESDAMAQIFAETVRKIVRAAAVRGQHKPPL